MVYINTGQYLFRLNSAPKVVEDNLHLLYGDSISLKSSMPVDYSIALNYDSIIRRFIRPQVTFSLGEHKPFKPLPASQSYPVVEWGMNWCIAATDFNRLIIHAAVLVKNGKAIIFPAAPGSGKSTLSAYFSLNGWQLFSDEMVIIDPNTLEVQPLYRPICLKNQSIDLVKTWFPQACITSTTRDTQKGDVAHVKGTEWGRFQSYSPTAIVGVVFPKYRETTKSITPYLLDKVEGFERLSTNAFNYNILGEAGFECLRKVIDNTDQVSIDYSELSEVDYLLSREFIT